ncbi:MAG: isocitrate lyase/phosphoenolpyruvate mutase family protein [Xanthobacteraceae bacterium]|nr:isocitrate lyase/phosphoenolpyruvate mutase family protein [Xanthobacteraceae bacterium]
MDWGERRERFRAIVEGGRCIFPGSVYDPVSARIAEELGYAAGMLAGSVAALAVLGAPDIVVLTLTEFADQARRINRAGRLPLIVDADHGYGNALNVIRTVEELETAGVAALTIEDTALPAAFGAAEGARLVTIAEGVGKMRAALAARQDPRLVIIGRTAALGISGLDDTIARLKAYEAAGVDMLFMTGMKTRAELDAVASAVKLPLALGGAAAELQDLDYLGARNVRVCLQGHAPVMAAVAAVHATLKALRDGARPGALTGLASAELMARVTRQSDYARWTKEFLGP